MSNLLSLDNICLAYGLDALLKDAKLQMAKGERICLIGRNGAGKSSLLKIIDGSNLPDGGTIWKKPNLRIARLAQDLPQHYAGSVYEFVAEGLEETGKILAAYHLLLEKLEKESSDKLMSELERLQHQLEAKNGWAFEQNIKQILMRLELNPNELVSNLSGGWQRRAALARSLVADPELLLLDEPTNHLDIEAIQWLEDQLVSAGCALLFITHDRSLLQRLATRIIELDRGNLTSWPGDYENFLRRKEEFLVTEDRHNAEFDKKLAQEERWIRQGIKARRTRNEGRVRTLEALRLERSKRRNVAAIAKLNLQEGEKSGQLVFEAKNVTHYFADSNAPVIQNLSIRIMRGDRIGLIGPNGVGKSTLLNLLLGKLLPKQGEVIQGTKLQIAYFDQLRHTLNPEKTVIDNVAEGRESIEINGKSQHIISYLQDFLFTPQRAMTQVKALSGGECNRLLLAKLFSQPANLLVMDEPTNDLDIETLELLEELLANFTGTILLVSHDRTFIDNVVTSTLVFEGQGKIMEYVGGYHDWHRAIQTKVEKKSVKPMLDDKPKSNQKRKLSFKEQKELEALPKKIELLETEQAQLQILMSDENFYKQDSLKINEVLANIKKIIAELEAAYQRWEELESLKN